MSLPSKIIRYPAGTFDLGDRAIVMPDGTTLEGAGVEQTTLLYRGTFDEQQYGIPGCAVIPGNNCIIRNLTIIVDADPHYAGCIGTRYHDGDRPSSGVLIGPVRTHGKTDNIYIRQPEVCRWRIFDSELETRWDDIVLAGALHELTVEDSTLTANSIDYQISGSPQS